ncbi:alpha-(1,3)-fucosyltransferase 7-like [Diadema antillarum]|uniref:alpha-(1,3)-fucosyltransferase 7-like n=1 Tax=Diadema antillarum TaxID=105358 RepID=UPI003A84D6B6
MSISADGMYVISLKQRSMLLILLVIFVFFCNSVFQTKKLLRFSHYQDEVHGDRRDVAEPVVFEPFTEPPNECVKRVHIYGNLTDMRLWPELSSWYHLFMRSRVHKHAADIFCPVEDCAIRFTIGTNVLHFRDKDAVIFGALPKAFEGRLSSLVAMEPEEGQTWFYYSTETPLRVVNWNRDLRVADLKYHKIMTYRSDSDIPIPFGHYRRRVVSLTQEEFDQAYSQNKTKLVAWMASNCAQIFWPRVPLVEQLSRLLPLDQYGKCGKMQCLPQRSERCNRMLQQYKFYMALANSECHEYITEKFWEQTLGQGVVPVIYGAPKKDFEKLGPPNSFIHLSDFSSLKEMATFLRKLNVDHESYKKYFEWGRDFEVVNTYPIHVQDLCRTIPHMFKGTTQRLRTLGNSTWYRGCRKPPSKAILTPFWPREQMLAYLTWSLWGSDRDLGRGDMTKLKPF